MDLEHIRLAFEDSKALIGRTGSALVSLTLKGLAVIPEVSSYSSLYHGVVLAPWPNRIAAGKYQFQGKQFQAESNEELGNALHGLLYSNQGEIESQTSNSVTLQHHLTPRASYPWEITVRVNYQLTTEGLRAEISATNNSDSDAPIGLGAHPYFFFDEQSTLEIRATKAFIHGADMIPVREIEASELGFGSNKQVKLEHASLDTQFSNLESNCAVLRTQNWSLEIFQEGAEFLMVYTTQSFPWIDGSTRAVAIEPQTSAVNAFNNGNGLITLDPKSTTSMVWGVRALPNN